MKPTRILLVLLCAGVAVACRPRPSDPDAPHVVSPEQGAAAPQEGAPAQGAPALPSGIDPPGQAVQTPQVARPQTAQPPQAQASQVAQPPQAQPPQAAHPPQAQPPQAAQPSQAQPERAIEPSQAQPQQAPAQASANASAKAAANPSAKPSTKVAVPSTAHVRVELGAPLQALLDADPRMQPWVNRVIQVADRCYAGELRKNPAAAGAISVTVTMHKNARPTPDINALPPALSGLVACATGDLMRTRMPLFTGPEGQRHTLRIRFSP